MKCPETCPVCKDVIQKMGSSLFKVAENRQDVFCVNANCFYYNTFLQKVNWNIIPELDITIDLKTGKGEAYKKDVWDKPMKKGSFRRSENAKEPLEDSYEFSFQVSAEALQDVEKMFLEILQCDFPLQKEEVKEKPKGVFRRSQ